MLMMSLAAFSCERPSHGAGQLPQPAQDVAPTTAPTAPRHAVLAGGCFWCVEAVFDQLEGVSDVVSGYAGGSKDSANYEAVSTGDTGHAEVVRITYDPSKITFGQLLRVHFATHDPTTLNRQGPDTGTQYRSAVFYANDDEKRVAESYIKQLSDAKVFDKPIVTTLEPLSEFHPAEKYHQEFVKFNPGHGYVRQVAMPKVKKVREAFPEQLKQPTTAPSR
jgi:peptide-methionine (S)-S-oxide reductase